MFDLGSALGGYAKTAMALDEQAQNEAYRRDALKIQQDEATRNSERFGWEQEQKKREFEQRKRADSIMEEARGRYSEWKSNPADFLTKYGQQFNGDTFGHPKYNGMTAVFSSTPQGHMATLTGPDGKQHQVPVNDSTIQQFIHEDAMGKLADIDQGLMASLFANRQKLAHENRKLDIEESKANDLAKYHSGYLGVLGKHYDQSAELGAQRNKIAAQDRFIAALRAGLGGTKKSAGDGVSGSKLIEDAVKLDTQGGNAYQLPATKDGVSATVPAGQVMLTANTLFNDIRNAGVNDNSRAAMLAVELAKGDLGLPTKYSKRVVIDPMTAGLSVRIEYQGMDGKPAGQFMLYRNIGDPQNYGATAQNLKQASIDFVQSARLSQDGLGEFAKVASGDKAVRTNLINGFIATHPNADRNQAAMYVDNMARHVKTYLDERRTRDAEESVRRPASDNPRELLNVIPRVNAATKPGHIPGLVDYAREWLSPNQR